MTKATAEKPALAKSPSVRLSAAQTFETFTPARLSLQPKLTVNTLVPKELVNILQGTVIILLIVLSRVFERRFDARLTGRSTETARV